MAETVRFDKHSSSTIVSKFPLLQVYFAPEQEKHFGWILFQAKDVKLLTIQLNKLVSKRPVIFMAHLSPTALTPAFAVFLLTFLRNVPTNWTLRRQAIIGNWIECVMSAYHKFSQFLLKCRVRHYPRELILLNIKNDTFSQTGCIYQKASKNNVCRDNFPTIVKFPASIRLATSRPQAECQYRESRYACGEWAFKAKSGRVSDEIRRKIFSKD